MKDLNFLKKKHSLHLKRKIPRFKEKKILNLPIPFKQEKTLHCCSGK